MATEIGLISASTHSLAVPRTPNATISANLTLFFASPQHSTPNTARKRRHIPDLSRSTASPSHGTQMATMFRAASVTLQGLKTPPAQRHANTKTLRMPLSAARSVRFGDNISINAVNAGHCKGNLADDHIAALSQRSLKDKSKATTDSAFKHWQLPRSSSSSSSIQSNPSSPTPVPIKYLSHSARIDTWLDGIWTASADGISGQQESQSMWTSDLEDKENAAPKRPSSPPIKASDLFNTSPTYVSVLKSSTPVRPRRCQRLPTPERHLSLPPRRKGTQMEDEMLKSPSGSLGHGQNFTIRKDNLIDAFTKLSPPVECHRKGRGPRRERCRSYFDENVVEMKGNRPPEVYKDSTLSTQP